MFLSDQITSYHFPSLSMSSKAVLSTRILAPVSQHPIKACLEVLLEDSIKRGVTINIGEGVAGGLQPSLVGQRSAIFGQLS